MVVKILMENAEEQFVYRRGKKKSFHPALDEQLGACQGKHKCPARQSGVRDVENKYKKQNLEIEFRV